MYTGWGKSTENTFSLWGRRGDRLYCSISSYSMGEGRTIRVWFFHPCIPRPSLVLSALSSLGHHSKSVRPMHREAKHTEMLGAGSRERFVACEETSGLSPKKP